jgi:hypothetical protein
VSFELRVGRGEEWERARVGEWESGKNPLSSGFTFSLNLHPFNPLNLLHCFVAELPSDFSLLTFQIK